MANEIEVSISLSVNKGGLDASRSESFKKTMAGDAITHSVQILPLSGANGEILEVSDDFTYTNGAMWFVKNLDATNYITIGEANTDAADMMRIDAGESTLFHSIAAIYAKGSHASNTVTVEYFAIEV